ncbi:hypothetical protein MBH78_12485 [Oceanimonas sp. NS1]|nr:hypothetical protein [Oceanimonas sp. NS1]
MLAGRNIEHCATVITRELFYLGHQAGIKHELTAYETTLAFFRRMHHQGSRA